MTITQITERVETGAKSPDEKIRMLRKIRAELLEELHGKALVLDQVDYMIDELKKQD